MPRCLVGGVDDVGAMREWGGVAPSIPLALVNALPQFTRVVFKWFHDNHLHSKRTLGTRDSRRVPCQFSKCIENLGVGPLVSRCQYPNHGADLRITDARPRGQSMWEPVPRAPAGSGSGVLRLQRPKKLGKPTGAGAPNGGAGIAGAAGAGANPPMNPGIAGACIPAALGPACGAT